MHVEMASSQGSSCDFSPCLVSALVQIWQYSGELKAFRLPECNEQLTSAQSRKRPQRKSSYAQPPMVDAVNKKLDWSCYSSLKPTANITSLTDFKSDLLTMFRLQGMSVTRSTLGYDIAMFASGL